MPKRPVLVAVIALACAALGFFGFRIASRERVQDVHPTAGVAQPDAPAEAGSPAEGGSLASKVPETLPDFTLEDRDGQPKKLADFRGRPLLINFWATWCEPCRREIPLLKSLRSEREAERLEVVGIAIDVRDPVLEYAKAAGIDYPLLIGEQEGYESAMAFGVPGVLPFSVFADSQGRVVTLKIGELHRDEADFILDSIREVESGSLTLADAKARIAARLRELATARAQS